MHSRLTDASSTDKWTLTALQKALNLPDTMVKAALHFWQSKGVLGMTETHDEQTGMSKTIWESLETVPADMDSSMVKAMLEQRRSPHA